ncbi:hypothetical protein BZG36_05177, partial [Bifiguratus adelaidae]
TAIAATVAMQSEFPFVKLISPENMVGFSESAKVTEINKVFNDSYKSPMSVIVVDDIERLLDFVPIGPRFSNSVLQALMVLLKKKPPKNRRLLILCTTSKRSELQSMDMEDVFDSEVEVPAITDLESVHMVMKTLNLFTTQETDRVINDLVHSGMQDQLQVGIKKLLMIMEMAVQDEENKVAKMVNTMCTTCRRRGRLM